MSVWKKPETSGEDMDIPDEMNFLEHQPLSLEKLCLNLIVNEFERFYFVSTVSKDEILQRNFQFLQRRYSVELLAALHQDEKLAEKYFEVLINEDLNFLDGEWFKKSRYLNLMEDIFGRLTNLTRICFKNCGDEILKNVAKFCPKIVEIDARGSDVTDDGVKYLCEIKNDRVPCPEIKILFLQNSRITDEGAECLIRNLPSLEIIDHKNVPVLLHSIRVEKLSKFQKVDSYKLTEISLLGFQDLPYYTAVLKTCLTICPKLESITCFITNKEQLTLFTNSNLKKLCLYAWKIDPQINIDNFIKLNGHNLTTLAIDKFEISIKILAEHCPVLENFHFSDVNFTDEDDDVIFPCLNKCCIKKTRPSATKVFCLIVSSSPKLESISLLCCMLSLEMKKQILAWCKNPSARYVQFDSLQLEMKFVRDILLTCPSLKKMCLTNCSFDDENTKKIVYNLAKCLPNKPFIHFPRPSFMNFFLFMGEYHITYKDYLLEYPEELYGSSRIYDSLYDETALKWNDRESNGE